MSCRRVKQEGEQCHFSGAGTLCWKLASYLQKTAARPHFRPPRPGCGSPKGTPSPNRAIGCQEVWAGRAAQRLGVLLKYLHFLFVGLRWIFSHRIVPRKMVKFSNRLLKPEGYTATEKTKIMKREVVANPSSYCREMFLLCFLSLF